MLSASPLVFGAVFIEQDLGSDVHGDTFEITFAGGAAHTELTELTINGDQGQVGFGVGDVFFDIDETASLGKAYGADQAFPLTIASHDGFEIVDSDVVDGTSVLAFQFEGFHAGETLVFTIDVDEVEDYNPNASQEEINESFDPITSGVEFQGSHLSAHFTAPHYEDTEGTTEFRNRYDDQLIGTGLSLPADDVDGKRDRTAGTAQQLQQQPKPIAISGTVYEETNLDMVQDPTEDGIVDVTLSLWRKDGDTFVDTGHEAVTDAQGHYRFGYDRGLLPGVYEIRQAQPDGYFSVGSRPGTVDGEAVGQTVPGNPDTLTEVAVSLGDLEAIDYDFAEARAAAISGYVYHDRNDDGIRDEDEEGIGSVAIDVVAIDTIADQAVISVTTDSNGFYDVEGLAPGTYRVVQTVQPPDYMDGRDRAGTVAGQPSGRAENPGDGINDVFLGGGQVGTEYNFGELLPVSLSGFVYHDQNLDGVKNDGEEPIPSVELTLLDFDGRTVATQRTDDTGRFEFSGLRSGNYSVVETQPDGWLDGQDAAGTVDGRVVGDAENPGDRISQIDLKWSERGQDYNFGEYLSVSIRGSVHLTSGDDDCFDATANHPPLEGVTVRLLDETGNTVASVATDADGRYQFEGLQPGTYALEEETPDGLYDGGERAGQVNGVATGRVARDDTITDIVLQSGQIGVDYDFCEHPPATLSGNVYHDRNDDGLIGDGEEPIANVELRLVDPDTGDVVATAYTNGQGQYEMGDLPAGSFVLRQVQPDGWLDGLDTAGTVAGERNGDAKNPGDEIRQIELDWGHNGVEYNFGEQRYGSIAGFVHTDIVRDCAYDPDDGEQPLAGVRLELLDGGRQVVQSTVTDSQGRYRFDNVVPGQYSVRESQPANLFQGGQTAGSHGGDDSVDDLISGLVVGSGQHLVDYDYCEEPPATISGFVFQDGPTIRLMPEEDVPEDVHELRDGRLTPDDTRLAGVTLQLRNGVTGETVDAASALPGVYADGPIETRTDANGFYQFTGLSRGSYAVYQVQPPGFIDGIDTPGTHSGIPFNRGEPVVPFVADALKVDPQNDAIVRIPMPPGSVSEQNNFSEIRVEPIVLVPPTPPDTPIPPPPERPPVYDFTSPLVELPPLQPTVLPIESYGSSGMAFSWHLSVVDAGYPRGTGVALEEAGTVWFASSRFSFDGTRLADGSWIVASGTDEDGAVLLEEFNFGLPGALPIAGDFDGDGKAEVGVFLHGEWYIDLNGNGVWDRDDLWAKLGSQRDLPVTGDWDGDGKDDIGIFGPAWPGDARAVRREPGLPDNQNQPNGGHKNLPPKLEDATSGRRLLQRASAKRTRADLIDHVFHYGVMADVPVVGDWNGDGIKSIGVFRSGQWHLDIDGDGRWTANDALAEYGEHGDIPITGDFNGDGVDDLGFYRDGVFYLDTNGNRVLDKNDRVIHLGDENDKPVVGDWDGDGTCEVAVYRDREPTLQARQQATETARKEAPREAG